MRLGLRVDVDTLRGTRLGVPAICRALAKRGWRATFYFSVGPDNMGRHLWRLLKPRFLVKMLRSNAPSLYGWDILLRGVFGPGTLIGPRCKSMIRETAAAGHEIGLHAWDHYAWQMKISRWSLAEIRRQIRLGVDMLSDLYGQLPVTSASPGWRCTSEALLVKEEFGFLYNSDCRGSNIFYPVVESQTLKTPQIPVNLPTYDELIGRDGVTAANYNQRLLDLIQPEQTNVLTIHAEAEGIATAEMFDSFLGKLADRGGKCCPLKDLLSDSVPLPAQELQKGRVAGRDGWVATV